MERLPWHSPNGKKQRSVTKTGLLAGMSARIHGLRPKLVTVREKRPLAGRQGPVKRGKTLSGAELGKVDGLEGLDGLPVAEVVEVAGGHRDGRVAEELGDCHHVHAGAA